MNWSDFFDRTLAASTAENWSQLAPMLGISDGAISHYRTGKRVPQVWVVAEALKVQGHPAPEKAAIEVMKAAALTSPERAFWKRLAATAAMLLCAIGFSVPGVSKAATAGFDGAGAERNAYYVNNYMRREDSYASGSFNRPIPEVTELHRACPGAVDAHLEAQETAKHVVVDAGDFHAGAMQGPCAAAVM